MSQPDETPEMEHLLRERFRQILTPLRAMEILCRIAEAKEDLTPEETAACQMIRKMANEFRESGLI